MKKESQITELLRIGSNYYSLSMKIVFVSNYLNHHQIPLSEELFKRCHGDYKFIATSEISEDRRNLGYQDFSDKPYLVKLTDSIQSQADIIRIINDADVVITGSAPDSLIQERIQSNKLTFRYTERWFKKRPWYFPDPRVWRSLYKNHIRYRNKQLYALAASAYFANDAYAVGAYKNKIFKWGYFPQVKEYDSFDQLYEMKKSSKDICSILWAGRFLDWKHPEAAIYVAERLKNAGCLFVLNIIGTGPLEEELKLLVKKKNLEEEVQFLGSMSPDEVRTNMEESDIFLFTSDRNEGWGAVLNESMNSACAVIASNMIGAAPFLINDGNNGLLFRSGNWDELFQKTKSLIEDENFRKQISYNAFETMLTLWNPKVAAERFFNLATSILENKNLSMYNEGPCSKAFLITNK